MNWLKKPDVARKIGVSAHHVTVLMATDPTFPGAARLSTRLIVFDEEEIETWMKSKLNKPEV